MPKVKYHYKKLDTVELLEMEESGLEKKTSQQEFVSLEASGSSALAPDDVERSLGGGADDFLNVGTDPTAAALEKTEKFVLRPYKVVLKLLGWIPLSTDERLVHRVLRFLLVLLWMTIIIGTCITQILSCFRRDSTLPTNVTNMDGTMVRVIRCEDHLISVFILTDLLLISSYLFGIYLFSKEETEYLTNLASKVFIKSAGQGTANCLVITIITYFIMGVLWVVLSFCVRIMTAFSVHYWDSDTIIRWGETTVFNGAAKYTLVILAIVGFLFFDLVYVAAVMNYACQSEMNIHLLRAIKKLVQDKGYGTAGLDGSIKDIIESRKYLRVLNGKTATATALILFNLGSAGITAIINLNAISGEDVIRSTLVSTELPTVTAAFNVILWMGLVTFPFIQAARVTDACLSLKGMGPELRARPQLYASTPQLELDSYITLTQAVRLRATMFGIPVYPWLWWAIFTAVSFCFLILFQTGIYSFTRYL